MKKLIVCILFMISATNIFSQNKISEGYRKPNLNQHTCNSESQQYHLVNLNNVQSHSYSILNLGGQALVGSGLAVGFSIIPLSLAVGDAWYGQSTDFSQTAYGIITLSSFLFGAATGVYWVAYGENSSLSYWETVGYSVIGGGIGTIIITLLATEYTTIPAVGGTIAALCPILSSMLYASFIADWPRETSEISWNNKINTHQNYIDKTKLFEINILQIPL